MIEKCIGNRKARQIQRIIRDSKVTLLCLLLTIIVLRGTIGAGKFGTPKQDFLVLRNQFASRKFHYRVLEDATSLSHNKDLLWDGARLNKNEKPRVLLVTGFSRKECRDFLIKNKIDYCRLHEIGLFYNVTVLETENLGFRAKLELIRGVLLGNRDVEFVWWMDSDVLFTDVAVEVPWERYNGYNLVLHGVNETVFDEGNWVGLNFGSFLIRNCRWSLDLIESWSKMGQRTGFEADDRSSMVHMLAKEKGNWGDKVYLENEYCSYGFWEEKRGFGDRRWPLVIHFVGCKPCTKVGDYSNERCLKQMERALSYEKLEGKMLNQVQETVNGERGSKAVKVS